MVQRKRNAVLDALADSLEPSVPSAPPAEVVQLNPSQEAAPEGGRIDDEAGGDARRGTGPQDAAAASEGGGPERAGCDHLQAGVALLAAGRKAEV